MPEPGRAIEWVVFDVGETILDETRIWNGWADWLGIPRLTFCSVLGAYIERGRSYRQVLEYFGDGSAFDDLVERRRSCGDLPPPEKWFEERDIYADVRGVFKDLVDSGRRVGIAGNQPREAGVALTTLNLPAEFTLISDVIGCWKPTEAFYSRVTAETGTTPDHIAYVGDRIDNDVIPARAAGMHPVHLRRGPWGHIQATRESAVTSTLSIGTLGELLAALDELEAG